jgi:site-specific recombinase XerD
VPLLVSQLLYGSGLRATEGLRLRVQDVDFGQRLLVVRDGKGQKDRTTPLPEMVVAALNQHLGDVEALHHQDLQRGFGRAPLPDALARKYPNLDDF